MLRVASCSHSYGVCHHHTSRFLNTYITSLQIRRSFASQLPYGRETLHQEKTKTSLADREVKVQKTRVHDRVSANKSDEEAKTEKLRDKIMQKLRKNGHLIDSIGFTGSPPDGLDALLGWNKIKDERIQRDMIPERRKKIEELAAKGDRLSQIQLEKILAYEKD